MDNQAYLIAAEKTEKKFPNGLEIPSKEFHELSDLFMDFIDTGKRIDELKKKLIYKGVPANGSPTVKLDQRRAEFLHAIMGMTGEVAEIASALGANLELRDTTHFLEELGDYRWYEAIFLRWLVASQDDLQRMNIRKLAARYPEKYTDEAALSRDYTAERAAMTNA